MMKNKRHWIMATGCAVVVSGCPTWAQAVSPAVGGAEPPSAMRQLAEAVAPGALSQTAPVVRSVDEKKPEGNRSPADDILGFQPSPRADPPSGQDPRVQYPWRRPPARLYEYGGYSSESYARALRDEAFGNLRAAGVEILTCDIVRTRDFLFWKYGFEIKYFEDVDGSPKRRVITGEIHGPYILESRAREEMNRTLSDLRARGYQIILGQTWRRSEYPWNYNYVIDYLHAF